VERVSSPRLSLSKVKRSCEAPGKRRIKIIEILCTLNYTVYNLTTNRG